MEIKKFGSDRLTSTKPTDYNDKFQVLYFEQTYF
jgi:hypothetical protein